MSDNESDPPETPISDDPTLPPVPESLTAELAEVTWTKPEVGNVLGPYRITAFIGGGGMALIYSAKHIRLGREVAVKVLRPQLASESDEVLRFFEEARSVNEIRHINIVDIFDFVEDAEMNPPRVYMVMELLEGSDLCSFIRKNRALKPELAISIAEQMLDGLTAVHQRNILHRDLKPSNVFLVPRGEGEVPLVKLLDFGLIKAFGQRSDRNLTRTDALVGTPEYMSPEQILGHDLDQRTDIYAAGLLLYEMLTAQRPFLGEQGAVLVSQAKDPPPAMSTISGTLPLSAELKAVVMRCLEKEPDERFRTAKELREALRACLDPGTPARGASRGNKAPWFLAAAAIVLSLAVVIRFGMSGVSDDTSDDTTGIAVPATTARTPAVPPDARPAPHDAAIVADLDAAAAVAAADTTVTPPRARAAPQSGMPSGSALRKRVKKRLRPKGKRAGRDKPVKTDTKVQPTTKKPATKMPATKKRVGEGTVDPFSQ